MAFYIASCATDGGIYRFAQDRGKLKILDFTPCDRPMYMAREGSTLAVLLRAPFAENDNSGIQRYRIEADGALTPVGTLASTEGEVGCHLAVKNGKIYVANYISGSVCLVGERLVTHEGRGVHPTRQRTPHTHSVTLSPDGQYVIAADLGNDTLYVYDPSLSLVSSLKLPAGCGPRHTVFSHDGKYLYTVTELGNTVVVSSFENGNLHVLGEVSTLTAEKESYAAAIRLSDDGTRLYVTNRGENTVAVFSVQGESVKHLFSFPTLGNEPRDFAIVEDGEYAVVTNQFSDQVVLYRKEGDTFTVVDQITVKAPLAVLYI